MSLWFWGSLLLRSACILVSAELLRRLLVRAHASDRHRLLAGVFAVLLLWPLLELVLPEIDIPWGVSNPARTAVATETRVKVRAIRSHSPALSWPWLIWIAGAAAATIPVALGYRAVARLRETATPLCEPHWTASLDECCREIGFAQKPSLLRACGPSMPQTFGLLRATILLPRDCGEWSPATRKAVLLHELAHVQRRDLWCLLIANAATVLWWFQPLCWIARRALRLESERACDAAVVGKGMRPSAYAAELLAIAQAYRQQTHTWTAAIAIAGRAPLEMRVQSILAGQPGGLTKQLGAAPAAALVLLAISASALTVVFTDPQTTAGVSMKRTIFAGLLTSAGLSAAAISGSVYDGNGAAIADAKTTLYNPDTAVTRDGQTGANGQFRFDALPAGPYILRVNKPGFASLLREFTVDENARIDRALVIRMDAAGQAGNEQAARGERAAFPQTPEAKQLRISGETEQAKLVNKVQPVYPAAVKAAGTQGKVMLEVVISAEGVPKDIRVLSAPSDDLAQSALEAVRQWRYSSTLLNGNPVEVVTEVMVSYTLTP